MTYSVLSDRLREALRLRQILPGLKLLKDNRETITTLGPEQRDAARLLAYVAMWVDLDYSYLDFVEGMLESLAPRASWKTLPFRDVVYLQLTDGIVAMHRRKPEAVRILNSALGMLEVEDCTDEIDCAQLIIVANYCKGRCYRHQGKYSLTEKYSQRAEELALNTPGAESSKPQVAVIEILKSWALWQKNKTKEAREEARKLLESAESALKDVDPLSYGNICSARGRSAMREGPAGYAQALSHFDDAIAQFKRLPRTIHPNFARAHVNKAFVHVLQAHQELIKLKGKPVLELGKARSDEIFTALAECCGRVQPVDDREKSALDAIKQEVQKKIDKSLADPEKFNTIVRRLVQAFEGFQAKAREQLREAEGVYKRLASSRGIGMCHLHRAFMHADAGDLRGLLDGVGTAEQERAYEIAASQALWACTSASAIDDLLACRALVLRCKIENKTRSMALQHHAFGPEKLRKAYFELQRARGVENLPWRDYGGEKLESNLQTLSDRLKRGAYGVRAERTGDVRDNGRQKSAAVALLEEKIADRAIEEISVSIRKTLSQHAERALDFARKAIELTEEKNIENKSLRASAYVWMGFTLHDCFQDPAAAEYYHKAQDILKSVPYSFVWEDFEELASRIDQSAIKSSFRKWLENPNGRSYEDLKGLIIEIVWRHENSSLEGFLRNLKIRRNKAIRWLQKTRHRPCSTVEAKVVKETKAKQHPVRK
jgi:tetratricopeptide (TPR) repeat protein